MFSSSHPNKKQPKKGGSKKKGRKNTDFDHGKHKSGVTASIMTFNKTPDSSTLYKMLASIASYASNYFNNLIAQYTGRQTVTNPMLVDVDEGAKAINAKLKELNDEQELVERVKLNNVEAKQKQRKDSKLAPDPKLEKEWQKIRDRMDMIRVEKVDLIPELIREHANRRVDLFFLLCILVYKTNVLVGKDNTDRTHGSGSKETGTQACHPFVIPNPTFSTRPDDDQADSIVQSAAWKAAKLLKNFISSFYPDNKSANANLKEKDSADLPFRDSLNMTTELPRIVNIFDGLLEGTVKKPNVFVAHCLEILNEVSCGKIDPIQALNNFGNSINICFTGIYKEYCLTDDTDKKNPKSIEKVLQYQREGTWRVIDKISGKADKGHVYMMMGLNQRLTTFQYCKSFISSVPINECFMLIQKEMLDPPDARKEEEKSADNSNNSTPKLMG